MKTINPAWSAFASLAPLFELTKQQIELRASDIVADIQEGEVSALETAVNLKKAEYFIECILKSITDETLKELDQYSENSVKKSGCIIQKKFNPMRADFSNSPSIVEQATKLKELQEFAKKLRHPDDYVDADGVVYKLEPPQYKGGGRNYAVEIK
ncbi:hypothetical protein [Runella sp.]|uniref:hypothetical protein n=1 Tax=Runella sp. TaxID=1960881 RepID=UPI003D0F6E67